MTNKLRLDFDFPQHWRLIHRVTTKMMARSFETYHPVELEGRQIASGARNCFDRWKAIERTMIEDKSSSLLDLGCAEGYFVHSAAARGYFALGIDADVRRLTIAQNTAILNRVEGAGFVYAHITPDFVEKLQPFDTVLFLSVLHHIMYEKGVHAAAEIMRAVRSKVKKRLVFDMGQSNETAHRWASLLPQMRPTPSEWISTFLKDVGFSTVDEIGETDAYQSDARRILFSCRP
jgi:O-antigen chain-terminating methyltransferase